MATRQALESEIGRLAQAIVSREGLELVEVALRGSPGRQTLRLQIDRPGPPGVGIADCQRVSQLLSVVLDDADLLDQAYVLEVSSPGVDRSIRTPDDIRRNTGRRVAVTTAGAAGAERTFRGTLLGCESGVLRLSSDGREEIRIPLGEVTRARQEVGF